MHPNSMRLMRKFKDDYLAPVDRQWSVLDVGARCVKRRHENYRNIFEGSGYLYHGMDVVGGRNVDLVGFPAITRTYDVVISGQAMEHVKRPWDWLKNLTQYYTQYICIIAPHKCSYHPYPIDTYRYFSDGMLDLFEFAGIKPLEIFMDDDDTVGIGTVYK